MFDIDLKAWIIWIAVGLAAGGGIYGTYIKLFGEAAKPQAEGYGLVSECSSLLSSNNALEVQSFLNKIEDERKKLEKSDGLMVAVAAGSGKTHRPQDASMGASLDICVESLRAHLSRIKS